MPASTAYKLLGYLTLTVGHSSHYPRSVPVGSQIVETYRDYQYERDRLVPQSCSAFVFLNMYAATGRDSPMKYQNTRNCLRRVAQRAGVEVRLHMLRHTAGTAWARSGTPIDVVQKLLGHQSPLSTAKYLNSQELHQMGEPDVSFRWLAA